ncbi:hypothetical protein BDV37DRAFT_292136 [Aspergillus pseudonomiae]|uniref:Uncharacterized protein n=1 Tax=Aspergillus pseudonomiae TaxID=1506151 RepID=A0A5N7DJX5_9EURO|nr:uncharacterized protein BDV37DRAFT_292136 [Aspergillus pseudonomiae]KAE8406595.1 hypothetical protein BDV37DRAFT_292136 [Aspergillus pseudonomiae]
MQSEGASAGRYSRYQGPSWDGQTQSATPDDGLYHPGQTASGDQHAQTSATGNGLSYSGQGAALEAKGRMHGRKGTTSGGSVQNPGPASVSGQQPQASTTTSGLQATQSTSTTQLAQTPTPTASLYLEGQNTGGNRNGGQLAADGSPSQAGVATPDDGLYHPEHANANGQGAQQWTPSDGLYHPDGWNPGSVTNPTSTNSRPDGTGTQLSSPSPTSSITSKPTATNDSSSSNTTNPNAATKIAVPVSVGVVAAAMVGVILWWLYRKSQAAKAARKRNSSLEEGDYMKDDGPSLLERSVAALGGYSLFKPSWKRTRVASHSSMRSGESSCNKYGDHVEWNESRAPGEANLYDLEKLQPPENTASTEVLAPEGPRDRDITKPTPTLRVETSSISTSTRVCTPPSLPEPSPPITPVDSKAAMGEVFSVEIKLKQGQTVTVSKVYDDGWQSRRFSATSVLVSIAS